MGAIIPQVVTEDRAGGAQIIEGSLKFDSGKSQYLNRTPGSAGNTRTFTVSTWFKRLKTGTTAFILSPVDAANQHRITVEADKFSIVWAQGTEYSQTSAVLRDFSSWYHLVIAVDTTQSVTADKIKFYINGRLMEKTTTGTIPSTFDFNTTKQHRISSFNDGGNYYYDGQFSQYYLIDGQALDASYFGYTDPLTNTWRPKKYTGSILYQFTGTTVANATGAKPILNTTDDVGEVLGSGAASDSSASSLQFAIPGGTSSGINLTDQNPTGRVSGLRNITNGGSLAGNTSIYKYYGGSLYITGGATGSFSTDVWNSIGSGQFTVEMWIYLASTSQSEGYGSTIISSRGSGDNSAGFFSCGFSGYTGNVPSLYIGINGGIQHYISDNGTSAQFPSGQWVHIAQTKDASNVVRTYRNGVKIAQGTSAQALNNVNRGLIGGNDYGSFSSFQSFYLNDIRVYNTAKYTGDSFTVPSNTFINRNSFYLPFDGNSPIGQDQSGNGNNWTPVNFGGSNTIEKATGALPILNTDGGGKVARVGVRTDSNASSLVLALPLVGIKSDFSNAINSGTSNKAITLVGSTSASSSSSVFYGGSFYFDGNADCIDVAASSDFAFGTGDFTVECWVNTSTYSIDGVYRRIFMTDGPTGNASGNFQLIIDTSAGALYLWTGGGDLDYIASGIVANGNWNHIAACRSGSTLRAFVNGVQIGSTTYSGSISPNSGTPRPRIGNYDGSGGNGDFSGYIQDFRIYKGLAKYTQNFIPASTDPDILPDTPSGVSYSSNVALVPSTDGAVSFQGTSGAAAATNYLNAGTSSDFTIGTSDNFTFEAFINPTSVSDTSVFSIGSSTTFAYRIISGSPYLYIQTTGGILNTGTIAANKWTHIAVTRNSGTLYSFIDGVLVGSVANTGSFDASTGTGAGTFIGAANLTAASPPNYSFTGQISNLHFVKGTALYTSNFTPPTAPITSVANTKLLCCKSQRLAAAADISPNISGINDGTVWSSYLSSAAGFQSSQGAPLAFDGSTTTKAATPDNTGGFYTGETNAIEFIPPSPIAFSSSVKVRGRGTGQTTGKARIDTGSGYGNVIDLSTDGLETLVSGSGNLVKLKVWTITYAGENELAAIEIDGTNLLDPVTQNGNAAASNFNPFTANINTQRGQEGSYCTLNPLDNNGNTLSNGNLNLAGSGNTFRYTRSSTYVNEGKWYWECTIAATSGETRTGPQILRATDTLGSHTVGSNRGYILIYDYLGTIYIASNPSGSFSNLYSTSGSLPAGTTVGLALDATNGRLWVSVNGVWLNGGNPGTGTNAPVTGLTGPYTPGGWAYNSSDLLLYTFGQKPFKFPPPAGFQPLALANTPRPTIVRPDQYVGVTTYTGTGASRSINVGWKPDFVWIKERGASGGPVLYDTVRGATKHLASHSTNGENTDTDALTSFNSDGFSLGSGYTIVSVNGSTRTYVAWAWKAGGNSNTYNINDIGYSTASAAGLTAGTITPTGASVNTKSGFSIITYTGNGGDGATISHGLGKTPSLFMIKSRSLSQGWRVFHTSLGATGALHLNSTTAFDENSGFFNNTSPNSTTFTLGSGVTVNSLNATYVAYLWAEIPGFSKFGSYTGNGSADGTVVVTGFKPRWIMLKSSSAGGSAGYDWIIYDTVRSTYNLNDTQLIANSNVAENQDSGGSSTTGVGIDILSNGFKHRFNSAGRNGSGVTYIYAAFAETPSFNLYGGQANAR